MLRKNLMNKLRVELRCLLKHQLENFPFHNLGQLLGKLTINGGTCFDHALKLRAELLKRGINARLHEAEVCLTGEKSHRLVRVDSAEGTMFLDSGTGWPNLLEAEVSPKAFEYSLAGIKFRTITKADNLFIERYADQQWRRMNRIPLTSQSEDSVLEKFQHRYSSSLPFGDELRFCWLKQNKFYRISGHTLSIFGEGKPCENRLLRTYELINCIDNHFPELTPDLELYLEQ